MKVTVLLYSASLLLSGCCIAAPLASSDPVGDLQTSANKQWQSQLAKSTACTKDKLLVRKEWGSLSGAERIAYTSAVLCLQSRPTKSNTTQVPGARSRFDDFQAGHILQTPYIHMTGSFLTWHRYMVWAYEQALRTECGYAGAQPYWGWDKWYADPASSPIFDGSDTSMSDAGNGKCVSSGPFKNMTINLGPGLGGSWAKANPRSDHLGYNPRCLTRKITNTYSIQSLTPSAVAFVLTNYTDIGTFQSGIQGTGRPHGAGHSTFGTEGTDLYSSPGEPAFYLHHGAIDRAYAIWQGQDLSNRLQVVAGGTRMFGGGTSAKLTDNVDLSNGDAKVYQIKDLVSTVDGPFCYMYE
jgi:tyrosinase